jgi:Raf kinase inhibitor-like YbhB/YbcL family protein
MRLESPAFQAGATIPRKYSEDGDNLSPPLRWTDVPSGVREFALVVDDPDAPTADPWVHWVMYGIPAATQSLAEGVPQKETLDAPRGARQGVNSWNANNLGYRGPAPPKGHGTHHYRFRLYALDQSVPLAGRLEKRDVLSAIRGHVLAEAELVGTYERRA